MTMPWHVTVDSEKWDDILKEPLHSDKDVFPAAIATQHYARGVAYASKGMVQEAEAEQSLFLEALKNPALEGGAAQQPDVPRSRTRPLYTTRKCSHTRRN